MEDLNLLRARLDELDKTLISVFEERCAIAEQVGQYKLETGKKVKDPLRERQVIEKRLTYLTRERFAGEVEELMQTVMKLSRQIQRKLLRQNQSAPGNGNYFLIGLPGSGKSSVGKALAKAEGMNFLDTDEEIEKKTGLTIPEIFKTRGEEEFREIESEVLREIAGTAKNTVVATGGGIVEREENRALLKKLKVFYLYRPIRQILKNRLGDRPLLKDDPKKIYALDRRRRPLYKEAASQTVGNIGEVSATVTYIQTLLDE